MSRNSGRDGVRRFSSSLSPSGPPSPTKISCLQETPLGGRKDAMADWDIPYAIRNRMNNALATQQARLDAYYEAVLALDTYACIRYVLERTTDDLLRGQAFGL